MNYDYSGPDRRKYQRLKLNLTVNYRVDEPWYVRITLKGQEIEATALNLSEGGMAIMTNYDIPVASVLFLKFSLFKINGDGEVCFYNPVETNGQVRSNVVCEKNQFRLGVCFVRSRSEINDRIGTLIKLAS
jgi:c-di-GMP-binding flagellar brake protein YcgR